MSREEKVVCVTGASGFIASWIVKLLLQRNYTIKASVRNLDDPKKTQHLVSLDGAKERLHLFEANLLEEGSFDFLVQGCVAVFHTASPVSFSPTDPQKELIEPAVKGTLNVLRSCTKFASIKRVILTSSMATIGISREAMALKLDDGVDEIWFSDPEYCAEIKAWYMLSKTLAEEAAWRFAKENGIDLVTTNAAYVIGPLLQPALNVSVEMILNLINGSRDKYPNEVYGCIDVRDVALAHILALEVPSANGRYCLTAHTLHYAKLLEMLYQLYPSLTIAQNCEGETLTGPGFRVSKKKAKSLGLEFTPLEETLRDTVESLKEMGFLNV